MFPRVGLPPVLIQLLFGVSTWQRTLFKGSLVWWDAQKKKLLFSLTYPHLIYLPYSCYSIWANDTKSLTRNKAIIYFFYIYMYVYICVSGGQNMTKLPCYLQWTWPKWVVPYWLWRFVCTSMLCVKHCKTRVSVSGWSPIGCEGFQTHLNLPSPLPTTLVFG